MSSRLRDQAAHQEATRLLNRRVARGSADANGLPPPGNTPSTPRAGGDRHLEDENARFEPDQELQRMYEQRRRVRDVWKRVLGARYKAVRLWKEGREHGAKVDGSEMANRRTPARMRTACMRAHAGGSIGVWWCGEGCGEGCRGRRVLA